jgi:hypothetical protein
MIGGARDLRLGSAQRPRLRAVLCHGNQLRDEGRVVARQGSRNWRTLKRRDDGYRHSAAGPRRDIVVPRICGCSRPTGLRDHYLLTSFPADVLFRNRHSPLR